MNEFHLVVPTGFGDISELAAGLAERVDEQQLMLYGPVAFEQSARIRFAVLLADDSPALQGTGRVVGSYDGGAERPDEARYDIVLDSLELEGMSEVVFERLLVTRQSMFGGEPATGEVSLEQVERIEQAETAPPPDEVTRVAPVDEYSRTVAESRDAGLESVPPDGELSPPSLSTGELDLAEEVPDSALHTAPPPAAASRPPSAPPTAPPAARPPVQPRAVPPRMPDSSPMRSPQGPLTRPSRAAAWSPSVEPRRPPRPSTGAFQHPRGVLPIPSQPPRPSLDPAMRVTPAPRPTGQASTATSDERTRVDLEVPRR
ncbi:MAG: hypothetical protein NZ898_10255 [Myxococcota bacterium]|nr:hypothetical protein [Myxococcota bacterium]MDW8362637.1 hypothetical protein [Myxococcales bacterium]